MKLRTLTYSSRQGSALVLVLILSFVTMLVLVSTLQWTTTNTNLSERHNEYHRTLAVAEAATEAVISKADSDYKLGGDNVVLANINTYKSIVPSSNNPVFSAYRFTDGQSQAAKTHVEVAAPAEFRNLLGKYKGLYGYASTYRIISNARNTESRFDITAAVRQDIELCTIPLFQFAIFYNLDLEIHPGAHMTISGPVHGNQNIYVCTTSPTSVTFGSDVTAAGNIINGKKPGDPQDYLPPGLVDFGPNEHDSGTGVLDLPVGTNNSPTGVRQIVEIPPTGESLTSAIGKERFHNKADMIVIATNGSVSVKSGPNSATPNRVIPWTQASYFISTPSFYNKRENKTVNAVQIDVSRLNTWNATNTLMRGALAQGDVTIIYVADRRTLTSSTQPGVRLVNGATLPPRGLTIATPSPLYVKGDYNVPAAARGTHDTSGTRPGALIGDAITILSANWNDALGIASGALSARTAADTTVNAAILAGIVETGGGNYSGGVENFPRFLENWSGQTFTYNGSMVVMFPSVFARAPWQPTGSTFGIYNAPVRDWAFDTNFRDPTRLPPGTPSIRALVRSVWAMIKPNTTTVAAP